RTQPADKSRLRKCHRPGSPLTVITCGPSGKVKSTGGCDCRNETRIQGDGGVDTPSSTLPSDHDKYGALIVPTCRSMPFGKKRLKPGALKSIASCVGLPSRPAPRSTVCANDEVELGFHNVTGEANVNVSETAVSDWNPRVEIFQPGTPPTGV